VTFRAPAVWVVLACAGCAGGGAAASQPSAPAASNAAVPASASPPVASAAGSATPAVRPRPIPDLASAPDSSVRAAFVDLGAPPQSIAREECNAIVVAVAHGHAHVVVAGAPSFAVSEALGEGDAIVFRESLGVGGQELDVDGEGLALVAKVLLLGCRDVPTVLPRVLRASASPELVWAKGAMHAHLDYDDDLGFYLGRLAGSAPVAAHKHDDSWEVLAAVDAAGTFVLDGKAQRLGPRQIVFVPKNTMHEWRPDPGSNIVAIQIYDPPGPEQRFKKLAAGEAADAGH
jgi:mannose-6-phosphate isomerase-like protein (cupin superfamily)